MGFSSFKSISAEKDPQNISRAVEHLEAFQTKEHANLNVPKPGLPETTASDPSKFLPWHLCGDSSPSHGTVWPVSETTCDAAQATSGLMT